MLIAYRHVARSGAQHLRCRQTAYSDVLKEKLRRVGSPANWIQVDQAWDYPLSAGAVIALDAVAKEIGETIQWEQGLHEFAEQHVRQSELEHQTRIAIERMIQDRSIQLEPYPCIQTDPVTGEACPPTRFQQILWSWSQRVGGVLMAWDPGCGKTRGAADAACGWYRSGLIPPMTPTFIDGKPAVEGGVLVVCPKTVMRTWQIELAKWQNATGIPIFGQAQKKTRLAGTPSHFHIVNYEGLSYVVHNKYAGLIIDECHRVANNTNQTQHTLTIAQRTQRRLGLSGTPMSNDLTSMFYPLFILDQGKSLGSSKTAFLEKYFTTEINGPGIVKHIPHADALPKIAAAMASSTYFIKKEEVLPDLPSKTHTPIILDMTTEQAKYYRQIRDELVAYVQDTQVTVEVAQAKIMKLLQICQGFVLTDDSENPGRHFTNAKMDALMELLTESMRGRKVVVWAYFKYEIKVIADMLRERGIKYVRIDGTIKSQRERDAAVDRFNSDPETHIFIRQLNMSEGVTLLAKECTVPCYEAIFCGLSYIYRDWLQAQDRIHRIGQRYPVSYTYLLTDGGYDRKVFDSVKDKSNLASMLQNETKDHYLKLLREDLVGAA